MATNDYKILTRKNYILKGGIKTVVDENTIIPFDNMLLETGNNDDPKRVVIPTHTKVLETISELKDITANTKWINTIEGIIELPTAAAINAFYNDAGNDALFVKDIITGEVKALSRDVKQVTLDNITYTTIQASINDGILYDLPENGLFETAIFTADGWKIDTSKNFIPAELNRLDGELAVISTEVTANQDGITAINARLSDQGIFLTQANLKDITAPKGEIAFSGTPTEPLKIPTRAEVGSMGARLQQNIDTLSSIFSTIDINGISDKATEALTKATDADAKASSVSGIAATAAQDAHDAKIAAAKASDDLAQEIIDRKAADAALDAKITTNTNAIATNAQTIAANKVILDGVKSQVDLDHEDIATNVKPALTSTTQIASEALSYGQDWNTTKGQVAMKSELDVKAVLDLKNRPITKVGTNSYKIDFGAWNGNPALNLAGISSGLKAIINIHRTTQTDPVQNRYNDLIDQHYNDATSDGTCTIYLADSLTTLEKTQYTATVIVSNTQATFSLTKADGTAANLNAGQEAVILAYQAVSITFEGANSTSVAAGDDVARGQIATLTQTVQTLTGTVAGKQNTLTGAQLGVLGGEVFTTALKTKLSNVSNVKVKLNTTDEEKYLDAVVSGELLAGKDYVDAKVASAGIPASVTTDLTQLKGVKVQKNGADLSTAQVALSALTSADLLVDKTYADAIVAGKQNSTLTSTIAGATTVVGALTSINANVAIANGDIATLKTSVNGKQNATDNSLTTTSKNIAGAINEINTWKTSATTELNKLSIDNTKLLELKTALGL